MFKDAYGWEYFNMNDKVSHQANETKYALRGGPSTKNLRKLFVIRDNLSKILGASLHRDIPERMTSPGGYIRGYGGPPASAIYEETQVYNYDGSTVIVSTKRSESKQSTIKSWVNGIEISIQPPNKDLEQKIDALIKKVNDITDTN